MKKNMTILGVIVAIGGPLQAQQSVDQSPAPQSAQVQQTNQPAAPHAAEQNVNQQLGTATTLETDRADLQSRPRLGQLEQADKVIGREVKGSQDENLGTVKDFAVDLHNGRLVEVLVGSGGVLGLDEQYRAVPPGQFTCDAATKTMRLNVDAARFNAAPSFKLSDWDANSGRENIVEVYKYYNATPYFEMKEGTVHMAKPVEMGPIQRAEKLIGTEVRNPEDERIGKVDNLLLDMKAGRVAEVILASGGFLGMGDQYSAVPPQAFKPGTNADTMILDTTKEALANAPHFKASEWPTAMSDDQVILVYRTYNIEPYFNTVNMNADNTAQNRNGGLTPQDQGTSQSDIETTRQIRKAIIAAPDLSVDAQNVKIITLNGHVTLRGTVKTQEEKRRVGDIAATITPASNIDNQLQVVPSPTASNQ